MHTVASDNDQLLFTQLSRCDYCSFELLFKKYYNGLCLFAFKYVQDTGSAEDIVSDLFSRLWEKREQLTIDTSVKSYLFTSVKNQSLDFLNRAYNRNVQVSEKIPEPFTKNEINPQQVAEYKELYYRIEEAISILPKQCGIIFRMSRDNGMKYHEIASLLGLSVKTVETQMGRALKNLRESLKNK